MCLRRFQRPSRRSRWASRSMKVSRRCSLGVLGEQDRRLGRAPPSRQGLPQERGTQHRGRGQARSAQDRSWQSARVSGPAHDRRGHANREPSVGGRPASRTPSTAAPSSQAVIRSTTLPPPSHVGPSGRGIRPVGQRDARDDRHRNDRSPLWIGDTAGTPSPGPPATRSRRPARRDLAALGRRSAAVSLDRGGSSARRVHVISRGDGQPDHQSAETHRGHRHRGDGAEDDGDERGAIEGRLDRPGRDSAAGGRPGGRRPARRSNWTSHVEHRVRPGPTGPAARNCPCHRRAYLKVFPMFVDQPVKFLELVPATIARPLAGGRPGSPRRPRRRGRASQGRP